MFGIAGLVLFCTAIIVVTNGNFMAAIAPLIGFGAIVAFILTPLRYSVTLFFSVVILFHNPSAIPMAGHWQGPLTLLSRILYQNLRHFTGIPVLKFNLIETTFFLFLGLIGVRTMMGNNIDRHKTYPSARPQRLALIVAFIALVATILWGMMRGGRFDQVLWQIRALFWMPLISAISIRAFKTDDDFRRLAKSLTVVCIARVLEGLYFYFSYVRPQGLLLEYIMTHEDSVWLVVLVAMLFSHFIETLGRRELFRLFAIGGFIMVAIVLNERRLAYVSLVLSLATIVLSTRAAIRRWVMRAGLVLLPILLIYIFVGLHSKSSIFSPVHNLFSVTDNQDASNWTRNVENFNLIQTLSSNPVLGTGWGHEYNEVIFAFDLSTIMPTYRFHPHNTLLGLLAFTGIFGFFLILIHIPVGVFLAQRAYFSSHTPLQRTTAMTSISIVITYLVQAFGDLGIESVDTAIVVGAAIGCVSNLVVRNEKTSPE